MFRVSEPEIVIVTPYGDMEPEIYTVIRKQIDNLSL